VNLDAVGHALIVDATHDADRARADAERAASDAVAAARVEAAQMLTVARSAGEAEARAVAAVELARARRRARELVLGARREAYERVRAEARRAVSQLPAAPGYGALLEGLTRLARYQLGDDVTVIVDHALGGVVATAGSRSVDYRLPVVADRCVAALAPEIAELWR
jgi:vacuolar-type H+-ATPase subunit E/Vma4